MVKLLYQLFRTARPRQWLKNLAVFAAVIFTGQLFNPKLLTVSFLTFLIFCAASSSSYFLNDTLDSARDRRHPFKKGRPLASGAISPLLAVAVAWLLAILGLWGAWLISFSLFLVTLLFLILEFSYSFLLKRLAIIDILAITGAYVLRVYAGEVVTGFHLSIWLFLTVLALSLFLAIGKRRAELTLVQSYKASLPPDTRASLLHYPEKLLDTYIAMTAASTWITYSFYTFLEKPLFPGLFWQSQWGKFFPQVPDRKWLMLTIPYVLFGMMRYMQLIYEKRQGEAPEEVLTGDYPLMLTVLGWGLTVILIIYGLGG